MLPVVDYSDLGCWVFVFLSHPCGPWICQGCGTSDQMPGSHSVIIIAERTSTKLLRAIQLESQHFLHQKNRDATWHFALEQEDLGGETAHSIPV